MNESRMDRMRDTWRRTSEFDTGSFDDTALEQALAQQSRDVNRQFRVALLMDITLKAVVAVALAAVLWLHRGHAGLTALNVSVLLGTLLCIGFERSALNAIPGPAIGGSSLRSGLESMLTYYRRRFKRALYLIGLSGPLVFYTGVVHYLWYRYGGLRPFDGVDVAMFGAGLGLAYLLSAGAQQAQFRQYVSDVENCLKEIEEMLAEPSADPAAALRARRLRHSVFWSLVMLAGVLLLAWLIAK